MTTAIPLKQREASHQYRAQRSLDKKSIVTNAKYTVFNIDGWLN